MALAIIMILYVSIGVLAAVGSMYLSYRFVPVRYESALYSVFLVFIAAFYLAFTSYFGDESAWRLETTAVVVFAILGCLGIRLPILLIAGYALHGAWDLLHEIHQHSGADVFVGRQATQVPLAYGAFCATFDLAVAAYLVYRRKAWLAA
ncbi:DUF6010 family protein [Zhongshania aliphaticivorans]|uniref:DUF6010 family protein n=1 Tax=Zhongshania aliphaticivorans TaxID=1470434 RepID=UPI0012E5784C|nr:DUF6010 family protein [Zhongshania aliphaticivorans]CAA0112797.1 Uncharacterised protein [Zhongshania aliphaticivorans]